MKKMIIPGMMLILFFCASTGLNAESAENVTVTILYDNYIYTEGTTADWGFSCLIEGIEKTILFDTGTRSSILLGNMEKLNKTTDILEAIVISHNHGDHTGGLNAILEQTTGLPVYFGQSFPASFEQNVDAKGGKSVRVDESVQICKNVYSTGEIQGHVNEQALILDTEKGLVVIVGCSHPGIVEMLKKVQEILDKKIYLVFGGFHLMNHTDEQIQAIIQEFRDMGVEKCGATHCTGDHQIALFREAFGDNYVQMGVGQVLHFPVSTTAIDKLQKDSFYFPKRFKLDQNYPNPFNGSTQIRYTLFESSPIKLDIMNQNGQRIKTLLDDNQSAGDYQILWNPETLASGIYYCGISTGDSQQFTKLILQK